jgi:hypothetical protein
MLEAILENAPSERVRERARETRERWKEAFGEPDEALLALGRALAERIRAFAGSPPRPAPAHRPPTRWTYYRPGAPPEVVKQVAA